MNVDDDIANPGQNEVELECESFLAQPPPRMAIPKSLLKAGRYRRGDMNAVAIMVTLSVGTMGILPLMHFKVSLVFILVICLSVAAVTLLGLVMLLRRSTRRRRKFLERGLLVPAFVIERGAVTSVEWGTVEQFTVRFGFEIYGASHEVSQQFKNIHPERTARYWSGEEPVRLLVDPLDETSVLWVEGTLMSLPIPSCQSSD